MKYKYLPHTADVKFQAFGKSLEEAFVNSAYATTDIITDHTKIKKRVDKKITIKSEDEKALLYDFLEHFIVILETEDFLLAEIKKLTIEKKGGEYFLFAEITGDDKPTEYEIHTMIKAMTYQEMEIEKTKKEFMVQVVLDL